jgi:peptide/nickel transport system permease protein
LTTITKTRSNSFIVKVIRRRAFVKASIAIISFFAGLAILSFFYLPYNPIGISGPGFAPPSQAHPFGTTFIGQDVFSEWIYGSRATLLVGFLTAGLTTAIGIAVGVTSGFIRQSDEPLMRATDVVLTLPALPLLIVIAAFFPPSIYIVSLLIAVLAWPAMARVLRSSVISLRELPFIEVAFLSGVSKRRIIFSDLLKHLIPLILAYAMFAVIGAILTEASLDFIGAGPITSYSWGAMLAFAEQNQAYLYGAWWWIVIPGVSITILGTAFALLAYALEDAYRKNL